MRLGRLLRAWRCVGRPEVKQKKYLDQSKIFVNISTDWQIVDAQVLNNLVVINDERSSETDSTIVQHTVFGWDLFVDVSDEWDINRSESTLFSWLFGPLHVAEVGVDWASDNFAVYFSEGFCFFREIDDFCWAHECEVEWVEEQK